MSLFSMAMSLPVDFPRLGKPKKLEVPVDLLAARRANIAAAEALAPVLKSASEPPSKYSEFVERCQEFKGCTSEEEGPRGRLLRITWGHQDQLRIRLGPDSPELRHFQRILTGALNWGGGKPVAGGGGAKRLQNAIQASQQQQQVYLPCFSRVDCIEVPFHDSEPDCYLANYTSVCSYCRRRRDLYSGVTGGRVGGPAASATAAAAAYGKKRYSPSVATAAIGDYDSMLHLGDKFSVLERLALLNAAAQRAQERSARSPCDNQDNRFTYVPASTGQYPTALIEVPESQLTTQVDVNARKKLKSNERLGLPTHLKKAEDYHEDRQSPQPSSKQSQLQSSTASRVAGGSSNIRPVSIPVIGTAIHQKPLHDSRKRQAAAAAATAAGSTDRLIPGGHRADNTVFTVPKVTKSLLQSFMGPGQIDDAELHLVMRQQFLRDVVRRSIDDRPAPAMLVTPGPSHRTQSVSQSMRLEKVDETNLSLPDLGQRPEEN